MIPTELNSAETVALLKSDVPVYGSRNNCLYSLTYVKGSSGVIGTNLITNKRIDVSVGSFSNRTNDLNLTLKLAETEMKIAYQNALIVVISYEGLKEKYPEKFI